VSTPRLRIAAINFLNPAPLMWDFEHPPLSAPLAQRYRIDRMVPAECAARLADGSADIGLIPIAALATTPGLRILPGSVIASKGRIRSLLLVRRAAQPIAALRSVAADAASRATLAYARILLHHWGNPSVPFLPMPANLDVMLASADAAILIGDPALLALEDRAGRLQRTDEELVYHDLSEEWRAFTGLPFVSAVWCLANSEQNPGAPSHVQQKPDESSNSQQKLGAPGASPLGTWETSNLNRPLTHTEQHRPNLDTIAEDFNQSRIHGLQNIDALVAEWVPRIALPPATIHTYLTTNIHYELDSECIEAMKTFFRKATECGILPEYHVSIGESG